MSDVEETIAVPKKAIDYIMGAGPDHEGYWFGDPSTPGLGQYRWRTRFKLMVANAPTPKPDPSPVCVESATLEKVRNLRDRLQGFTPGSWEASLCITANEIEAELVNARSVESVKAERDRDLIEVFAAKSQEIDQSDENGRALALSYINAVQCLRALTEGEG